MKQATAPLDLHAKRSANLSELKAIVLGSIIAPTFKTFDNTPIDQFTVSFSIKDGALILAADSPELWRNTYLPELMKPLSRYKLMGMNCSGVFLTSSLFSSATNG